MSELAEKWLNLVADNPTERRILDYLKENASVELIWRINTGKKTLAGALEYAKKEAQKLAAGASSICVDDETVFGWVIHFFEEDSVAEPVIKSKAKVPGGAKKKPKAAKKAKAVKAPTGPIALELFSSSEMGVMA